MLTDGRRDSREGVKAGKDLPDEPSPGSSKTVVKTPVTKVSAKRKREPSISGPLVSIVHLLSMFRLQNVAVSLILHGKPVNGCVLFGQAKKVKKGEEEGKNVRGKPDEPDEDDEDSSQDSAFSKKKLKEKLLKNVAKESVEKGQPSKKSGDKASLKKKKVIFFTIQYPNVYGSTMHSHRGLKCIFPSFLPECQVR